MTEANTEREIVYLDADDEITSAAARLRAAALERVVFVLPYGSRLATSRINFRLLAREAGSRGKQLEIVAADASTRALAGSAGLTVHTSVAALEAGSGAPGATGAAATASEPPSPATADGTETRVLTIPRQSEPVPTVGPRRPVVQTRTAVVAGAITVALLAVAALGAYVYLPSATIVLTPTAEQVGPLALTVEARTDVPAPDPASMTVPATTYSFDLSAMQTFPATGTKVTETKAAG